MASITVATADKLTDSTFVRRSISDQPFNMYTAYFTLMRCKSTRPYDICADRHSFGHCASHTDFVFACADQSARERARKTDWYMSLFDERSVASNRKWATALGQPSSKATKELLKFMRWLGYDEGLEGAPELDFPELTKLVTAGIIQDLEHRHTSETKVVVRSPSEIERRDDFDSYHCG